MDETGRRVWSNKNQARCNPNRPGSTGSIYRSRATIIARCRSMNGTKTVFSRSNKSTKRCRPTKHGSWTFPCFLTYLPILLYTHVFVCTQTYIRVCTPFVSFPLLPSLLFRLYPHSFFFTSSSQSGLLGTSLPSVAVLFFPLSRTHGKELRGHGRPCLRDGGT